MEQINGKVQICRLCLMPKNIENGFRIIDNDIMDDMVKKELAVQRAFMLLG